MIATRPCVLRAALLGALPALVLVLVTGCTSTQYSEAPDGTVTFSRTSFLNVAKIAHLSRSPSNGLVLEGYANDQVAGAAAITRAAIEAALSRPPTPSTPLDP